MHGGDISLNPFVYLESCYRFKLAIHLQIQTFHLHISKYKVEAVFALLYSALFGGLQPGLAGVKNLLHGWFYLLQQQLLDLSPW